MNTYLVKLKHIVPCFLIISIGNVIGLGLFRWLFSIQFQIININEEVWGFIIPIALPLISILIWLRPRFRILTFKDNSNGRFGFQLISLFALIPVMIISQAYLSSATGKLVQLFSVDQINSIDKARYYKLDKFAVATHFGGAYTDFRTSGKYNQYLNFDIYFVTPILLDSVKKLQSIPHFWYGVKFTKEISNRKSAKDKEEIYNAFYEESLSKMIRFPFYFLDHFERTPKSNDFKNYLRAIESSIKQNASSDFIIFPFLSSY